MAGPPTIAFTSFLRVNLMKAPAPAVSTVQTSLRLIALRLYERTKHETDI